MQRPLRPLGWVAALALVAGMPLPASTAEPIHEPPGLVATMLPELAARMRELPPFLRDSRFTLHLRTFYQNVETKPDKVEEAWTAGGWLEYASGWQWDTLAVGATLYTSQPLYAPASREGTLLLQPDGDGFTVLGEAWAKLRYDDQVLTGYRQQVNLGYVNPYDGRMAPNTFEGVMFNGKYRWLDYAAGFLTQMKPRNSETFISMSEAAGANGSNEGAGLGGIRMEPSPSLRIEANTVYAIDTFGTVFTEAKYSHALGDEVALSLGVQYTNQQSVGRELLGSFSTWTVGARAEVEAFGFSVAPAFHRTGSGQNIQSPFGRWPGYLKMLTKDFDLARQTAFGVRLGYDLGRVGAPGLDARFSFAAGMDAIGASTGKSVADEREYDFDVIYALPKGFLIGLSFRVRVGLVQQVGTAGLLPDVRLIMNYELPVLRGALARRVKAWWMED